MTVGDPESKAEGREQSCVKFYETVYRQQTEIEAASLSSRYQRRRQRLSTAFSRARSAAEHKPDQSGEQYVNLEITVPCATSQIDSRGNPCARRTRSA